MKRSSLMYIVSAALLLVSCGGYSAVGGGNSTTATVEVIRDDGYGILRNSLAERLSESRNFTYTSASSAKAQVVVELQGDQCENVGYAVDIDPKTLKRGEKLFPAEANRSVMAKVSVIDVQSGRDLVEPFTVSAEMDFDFMDPKGPSTIQHFQRGKGETTLLRHSMGQLDSKEGAMSETQVPLYQSLARKIVQHLARAEMKAV